MNENKLFDENRQDLEVSGKKPVHTASLVLGVLSIVFAPLVALVGDILAIIGIVLACSNKKEYRTTAALVCSIIGLVLSVVSHILGFLLLLQLF